MNELKRIKKYPNLFFQFNDHYKSYRQSSSGIDSIKCRSRNIDTGLTFLLPSIQEELNCFPWIRIELGEKGFIGTRETAEIARLPKGTVNEVW